MKKMIFIVLLLVLACKPEKKYHDVAQEKVVQSSSDALKDIFDFQKELNEEFKDPETSPLPDRYRKNFETLDFFPPDTSYVIKAKFVRTPEALPFLMPTTTDRKSKEVVYGIAYFTLNGEERQLEIYQNEELMQQEKYRDYLFLPFTDDTNGESTYTGGRYIDLTIPVGDSITIDFNTAYNPYCAYNKKFSCPIVPSVNTLNTKVVAGVKAFEPN
ncbi:DUF1684 domain-containing protein [Pseudozobellia sp. WGM2]|uniref:DUF1684 domain-containing protein n=1 Tax=Pseudozobellia sp. WGM2 TaxID=2787625 RepID=UPI001ADF1573|nr:DUF1684 domain-containing protein [Pseudozobellia sp. WGM2]